MKGEDYADKEVIGRDVVETRSKVVLTPFLSGRGMTHTLQKPPVKARWLIAGYSGNIARHAPEKLLNEPSAPFSFVERFP